ncbi:MAG: hypothetical protein LBO69_07380 [Ignavibacteria bacterium]|nr:hypothetical protein [Ignavibacteria bacterium]
MKITTRTPVCVRVVGCDGTVTVLDGKVPDGYTATPGCGNVGFVSIWDLVDSIRISARNSVNI